MRNANGEARYDVIWPLGHVKTNAPIHPRLQGIDLSHKAVALVNNGLHRASDIFAIVRDRLTDRYPAIRFADFELPRGWDEQEVLAKLPKLLHEGGCDAVITGVGGGVGCTLSCVRVGIAAEAAGIPSVTVLASAYAPQGHAAVRALGAGNIAFAEYPGVTVSDSEEELRRKVEGVLVDKIVQGFATPTDVPGFSAAEPGNTETIFQGTLRQVQDYFHEQLWTDGLPIVPPTVAEVEQFLKFTDRSPEEVIGVLPVENREATIWNVAVNGVMAGCRPEYMPVLIAAVEAIADPAFHIEDAGSTPGWEPLIIVNGPIIKRLNFNHGAGVLRVGRQSNASIGRFLRLFMINVVGCRIAPGVTDKGSIGATFNVVLAEDEEAVATLGWPSFSVDQGFEANQNVLSVQSSIGGSFPIYPAGDRAGDYAKTIAEVWGGGPCTYWSCTAMSFGKFYPLLVITPRVAAALAKDGWTKQDLREYLAENVKVRASLAESWARQMSGVERSISGFVRDGRLPKAYGESADPDRLVPVFLRSDWIGIVVAGDPYRNQVRGFLNNHMQGVRISRKIKSPVGRRQMYT